MPIKIPRYGWSPDLPDHRDHVFALPPTLAATLPTKVDLRPECPPVYDQGQLGSCTANAIAGAVEFDLRKQKVSDLMPSRLFIYYNERSMEGTVGQDAGAQIRDGIKSVNQLGVCAETEWPYSDKNPGPFRKKPTAACYKDAAHHQVTSYQRVSRTSRAMKTCLAAGYPFVFGFTVYDAFESPQVAKTGVLNLPAAGEQPIGGHAVLAVGYDDASARFIVRNSWSAKWGQKGYFTIPYEYLLEENLADDFWTVRAVET